MGKADKPRALKDCIHEILVVSYNTHKAWFASPIFSDWFFKHFVPEVRYYYENVVRIAPEKVKALLLDSAPANPNAEKFACSDGKIRTMYPQPNTTDGKIRTMYPQPNTTDGKIRMMYPQPNTTSII